MPDYLLALIPIVVIGTFLAIAFVRRRRSAPIYLNGEDESSMVVELNQQQPSVTRTQPHREPPVDRE